MTMQSFTEEIKNEIISRPVRDEKCGLCLLSAFIRTSGSIISKNGVYGFEIVTENERTADFIADMLENMFGLALSVPSAKFDLLSGKDKLYFESVSPRSEELLYRLGIVGRDADGKFLKFGIDEELAGTEEEMTAFLKGAFLGGGSCTLPDEQIYSRTGYHFEIVFSNRSTASDFCDILAEFEVLAKLVSRKESAVVYIKSKEVISDVLNILGCYNSLDKLSKIIEIKEVQNNANRATNCSVSNIDKTVSASVKQCKAIEIIAETVGLKCLDKPVFDVAMCRLADKNASMQELSDRLNISKSCLNHRMKKILDLAQSLSQD